MTTEKQPGKQEGIKESQQDHKQDDVARSRPAQTDQQIHDTNTKRPPSNSNPG